MDWHQKKKVARNTSRLVTITILAMITYLLYSHYRAEHLAEYQRQNVHLQPKVADSAKPSSIRATVKKETDSIKKTSPGGDTPSSFYIHVNPSEQTDSVTVLPAVLHPKEEPEPIAAKEENNTAVLQGPTALFSHTYTIGIGKTIQVNVLWADADAQPVSYKLITIKADDIAGNKARFTIEDPFDVLLFSQTGYGMNDNIMIEDERHNIHISVAEVRADAVVVRVESSLNEKIVSGLKRAE